MGTWLIRIALNLARDHARSRRVAFWRRLMRDDGRSAPEAAHLPDAGPSPERTLMARERLAAVQAAVDRLPHRQHACFLLRFVEGMTLEEIAQALHLRVGTGQGAPGARSRRGAAAPRRVGRVMRGHLTDGEMTAYAAGALDGDALAHLAGCPTCCEECARLRDSLAGFAAHVHGQAERPEAFFRAQRARIVHRLGEGRRPTWRWRWAWAPAVAVAALLAVFLTRGSLPRQTPHDSEADQALLSAVQRSIRADVPSALRPAALLVAEVERSVTQAQSQISMPRGDQP